MLLHSTAVFEAVTAVRSVGVGASRLGPESLGRNESTVWTGSGSQRKSAAHINPFLPENECWQLLRPTDVEQAALQTDFTTHVFQRNKAERGGWV